MKKINVLVVLTLFLANVVYAQALFQDGSDDWNTSGSATWTFADGVLIGNGTTGSGFVLTKTKYKDFELTLDFFPDADINSGVFIRCESENPSAFACYEINICDNHSNQNWRTGSAAYKEKPLVKVNTVGKWNTYKIKNVANHLEVWIDDVKTIDIKNSDLLDAGFIGLQALGNGKIMFKNIKITEVK